LIIMLGLIGLIQADVIQIHLLQLPVNNRITIGISPKMWDKEAMMENALGQASVLFTRMDSAYSVDNYISVQRGSAEHESSDHAQLQYNVVSDMDKLKMNYQSLLNQYDQEIYGNYVAFFAQQEIAEHIKFELVDESQLNDELAIRQENGDLFSFGSAKNSKLDEALDSAFDKAMFEYSKYMGQQINSLQKEENDRTKTIYERKAVNKLHQLEFSRIQIEVIRNGSVIEYQVKTELRKRISND